MRAAVGLARVPDGHARRAAGNCRPRAATARQVELRAGGIPRRVYIVDPGLRRPAPVVIALHGWGGNGKRMASYSGLGALATRQGFVAAFPSSLGLSWNISAARRAPDDVRFLRAVITYAEAADCGDASSIFITGVSNGAGMAALAGCRLASSLRAIAPVAGDYDPLPPCHPARPLAVLEIHGTRDQEAGYFGRSGRRTADRLPPFVNAWVRRDGCQGSPARRRVATRTLLYRWSRCRDGSVVEHLQIQAGRHQWPGATPPDPGPPAAFSAASAIWRFFSRTAARSAGAG